MQKSISFPRSVARKILEHGAKGEKRVVVVLRNGRPSTVRNFDKYLAQMDLPKQVKPWEKRKGKPGLADSLGAIDAAPPQPLTRASMYDMDED
ncbi:MAG: hypothetical protein L0Y71_07220 [Gemmataceae bacterium]|nr:hypothetical protein [Gemmataceae bacterium]